MEYGPTDKHGQPIHAGDRVRVVGKRSMNGTVATVHRVHGRISGDTLLELDDFGLVYDRQVEVIR